MSDPHLLHQGYATRRNGSGPHLFHVEEAIGEKYGRYTYTYTNTQELSPEIIIVYVFDLWVAEQKTSKECIVVTF